MKFVSQSSSYFIVGVYLSKFSDLLQINPFEVGSAGDMIIFKVMRVSISFLPCFLTSSRSQISLWRFCLFREELSTFMRTCQTTRRNRQPSLTVICPKVPIGLRPCCPTERLSSHRYGRYPLPVFVFWLQLDYLFAFQQYFFEFAFDEIKARPRQVCPYAVVSFQYKGKDAAATPFSTHR